MIDPLLGDGPPPTAEPAAPARRGASRARGLRVAGAAGVGSLMAITGYMTGAAGGGATPATDASASTVSAVDPASAAATTTAAPTTSATAAATATSTTTAADPSTTIAACTTTYTVQAGDSWVGIARRASVVVDILYVLNGTSAESVIHPGDSICIPDGIVVATTAATTTTAAPVTSSTTPSTTAPVVTTPVIAAPAAPAAQPQSNSSGS